MRGGAAIAPVLAAPLVVLLALNGLNLIWILGHLRRGGSAGGWLGLLWGALTLLGLLVALRACRDPAAGDPTPWLAIRLPATLMARDPAGLAVEWPVQVSALSERGAALEDPGALPPGHTLEQLHLQAPNAGLPPLPLRPQLDDSQLLSWAWPAERCAAKERFQGWLFGRRAAWPERLAPPEWRAFGALLRRLISPGWGQRPRLSLVPQQLVPPLAPDRCDSENHSGRPPASAS